MIKFCKALVVIGAAYLLPFVAVAAIAIIIVLYEGSKFVREYFFLETKELEK